MKCNLINDLFMQDAHISDEATVLYSRAKQFTEEKLGKSERTELDAQFDELARKTDKIKGCTEKFVKDTEAVLVPNPGKSERSRNVGNF